MQHSFFCNRGKESDLGVLMALFRFEKAQIHTLAVIISYTLWLTQQFKTNF